MNNTNAAEAICQALWPGPGVPSVVILKSFGRLPSLSLWAATAAEGSVLPMYASSALMRSESVGAGGGAGSAACAVMARSASTTNNGMKQNIFFMGQVFGVVGWLG